MILIKGGTIIDGTLRPPFKGDILISGDKISSIGNFPSKKADETIDAFGMYVSPGFIDPNTDSDHNLSLFLNPNQENFLLQGVTTIIGGNCGSSLAPLIYGTLESIRKWTDVNQINVNWHTVAELIKTLEQKKPGVNFATLIGHSTIRRSILGEDQRDLTDKEIEVFKSLLKKAMEEGGFGLSTGLGYAHSKLTPYPEIKTLAGIVAGQNGVYATHLRSEKEKLISSIEETIKLGKDTGVKIIISHLRPLLGYENQINAARNILNNLDPKIDLHYDVFPFDSSLVPIYTLLPEWAKRGGLESMWGLITSPTQREHIKNDIETLDAENVMIAEAPGNNYLVGKSLYEIAKNQETDPKDALVKLMTLTRMKALLVKRDINLKIAEEMLFDERSLIATNSGGNIESKKSIKLDRSTGTFPKFLKLAFLNNFPLEKAVRKITDIPARKFGLEKRGTIKHGHYADIAIFETGKIAHTIVNGKIAVEHGKLKEVNNGYILRKNRL